MQTFGFRVWASALWLTMANGAQAPNPVHWSVRPPQNPAVPGTVLQVTLAAAIDSGWHIYSLTQPSGGPIPLRITLPNDPSVTLAGAIRAPAPEVLATSSFDVPVELYSGTAKFIVPIKIASSTPAGPRTVRLEASWQSCSATTCLAPRSLDIPVQFVVR